MKIQNFLISGILALSVLGIYNEANATVMPTHIAAINVVIAGASHHNISKSTTAEINTNANANKLDPKIALGGLGAAAGGTAMLGVVMARILAKRDEDDKNNKYKKNI